MTFGRIIVDAKPACLGLLGAFMSRTTLLATPALLAALICMPAPAGAGQRGGHSRGGGGGR